MFDGYKDVLTVKEVCSALSMGKNTIYNIIKEKKLKSIQIGKKYYIPKTFLIEFIESYR